MADVRVVVYLDPEGRSPFTRWFEELNAEAAAKVTTALYRLGQGNFSNVEGVGGGVFEYRIDFGPGYRVYFGKDGRPWLSCWAAAPRSASSGPSRRRTSRGRTINAGKRAEGNQEIEWH